MKAAALREMSVEELRVRLDELLEEAFNLRFQHTVGQLASPIRLRQVGRDIAQVHTILRQYELGLIELASTRRTEGKA